MDKNLIVLPSHNEGSQPEPKRSLILSIGGRRYEIRIDAKMTELRDTPAEIIAIDDGKRSEG
jgi:hypothetical protein